MTETRLDAPESRIRVLIADDHAVVREGLVAILSRESDIEVVAEAADGREALVKWERTRPNVAVLDLRMPGMGGLEAARRLLAADPAARVVLLTTFDVESELTEALEAGALGFLLKDAPPAQLSESIRSAFQGEAWVSPRLAARLARVKPDRQLTEREVAVLRLMTAGLTNKAIGRDLGIAEETVKTHVKSILAKLDAASRMEAMSLALRRGLVSL